MSAFGGPNVGKEVLDKLIFSFSPEQNGLSQPGVTPEVSAFPLPKHSFNVVTSSLSPFYNPPVSPNDGWWGNQAAFIRPQVITYAPEQISGEYTSWMNNNIAFQNLKYNVNYRTNPSFLTDGVTICGFINVDRFPRIATNIKRKLGITSIFSTSSGAHPGLRLSRTAVRLSNDDTKFCFGAHFTFFNNLSFSLCTDYIFDIKKWYFYSVHFRYNSTTSEIEGYMTVDGVPVVTHTSKSFSFINRRVGYLKDNFTRSYKGTEKNSSYPLYPNFIFSLPNTVAEGTRNIFHAIPINNGFQNASEKWIYENVVDTPFLSNESPIVVSFLELRKSKNGLAGLHDNIRLGQQFIINTYDIPVDKIYSSYKSLYL